MQELKRLENAHYQAADALVELLEAQACMRDQEGAEALVSGVVDTAVSLAVEEGEGSREEKAQELQALLQSLLMGRVQVAA